MILTLLNLWSHMLNMSVPLVDTVDQNNATPLGPAAEPVVPYQIPYDAMDPNLHAVEHVHHCFGSPYGPVFEPFTAYSFPEYYGLSTHF